MTQDINTDVNQVPETINLPDESGQENAPSPQPSPNQNPHVPPVEVPGREQTPEQIPPKGRTKDVYPFLIKG